MRILFGRPFLILFMSAMALVYSVFEYNMVLPLAFGFTAIGVGNMLESAMSFIQLVFGLITSPGILSGGIIYFAGGLVISALAAGALLSGFLYVLNNTINGSPRASGEYIHGLKTYFSRISAVTLVIISSTVLYILFMMIVSVPAITVTRAAASGRLELFAGAVVTDVVTLGVLFFGCMFFRIYTLFWYPSSINYGKGAFIIAKRIADSNFWSITGRFILFDLVFILLQGALLAGKLFIMHQESMNPVYTLAILGLDWIFKTVFFGSFIVYIFSAFKAYNEAK